MSVTNVERRKCDSVGGGGISNSSLQEDIEDRGGNCEDAVRLVRDFYEIGYQFASQQHQDGWIKSDMGADHHFSSFRIRLHT